MLKTYWMTINRACQLRCRWCYGKGKEYKKGDDADFSLLKRIVDVMAEIDCPTAKILGGEPTLYPHLIKLLGYLKQKSVKAVMTSNGLIYENADMVKRHFDAGLLLLIISLKTGSIFGYKHWTGRDAYKCFLRAVENTAPYNSGISVTVTSVNTEEIIQGIADCVSAGTKFVNVDFCSPSFISGKPDGQYLPDAKTIQSLVPKLSEFLDATAKRTGIKWNIQLSLPFCLFDPEMLLKLFQDKHSMAGCIARKKSGVVFGTKGEVGFCNHLLEHPFGKIGVDFNTGKELEDLYYSQEAFFGQINRMPDRRCKECPVYLVCCGGCPIKWTCNRPCDFISGGERFVPLESQFMSLVTPQEVARKE